FKTLDDGVKPCDRSQRGDAWTRRGDDGARFRCGTRKIIECSRLCASWLDCLPHPVDREAGHPWGEPGATLCHVDRDLIGLGCIAARRARFGATAIATSVVAVDIGEAARAVAIPIAVVVGGRIA